jgi:palmitoyltransferase
MHTMRRHGWQRPIHPLQVNQNFLFSPIFHFFFLSVFINLWLKMWQFVGMGIYSFLVVCFYTFLGLFLGNRTAEITLTSIFSFMVIY